MTPVQIAATVLACTLLACAAVLAAALTVTAAARMWSRSRCAVCQGGGHPADYPTPQSWSGHPYRMCTAHLAANIRRKHLEQETR